MGSNDEWRDRGGIEVAGRLVPPGGQNGSSFAEARLEVHMAHGQQWDVKVLDSGRCEPMKAAVHGVLLLTMGVCAAYNAAAWIRRRQRHLAVNAVIYSAGILWERCHIAHHLAACGSEKAVQATPPAHDLPDAA
jgi:hypothetical protein